MYRKAKEAVEHLANILKIAQDNFDMKAVGARYYLKYQGRDVDELLKKDLYYFLLYLSASDGIVVEDETEYLEQVLGKKMDPDKTMDYIEENNIYSTEFEKKVPLIAYLGSDLDEFMYTHNAQPQILSACISLFEKIGQGLLACDSNISIDEARDLNIYLEMLRDFQKEMEEKWGKNDPEEEHTSKKGKSKKEDRDEESDTDDTEETLEDLMEQLNNLTGLQDVKREVNDMITLMQVRQIRKQRKLKVPKMSLHMVFSGNPGTGKTTVARLIAKIYHKIGVLSQGQLVEVDRSGLVGGYVGQTALKVKDVVGEAMGGILFIDEAYALAQGGETDYGKEAINTLLKCMEDNRDDLIVIVVGYPELMRIFLDSNPGLRSRFNKFIYFRDYNSKELLDIFLKMCKECGYVLEPEAEDYLKANFEDICDAKKPNFANGREVRNFYERLLIVQSRRLLKEENPTDEELNTFILQDLMDCEK